MQARCSEIKGEQKVVCITVTVTQLNLTDERYRYTCRPLNRALDISSWKVLVLRRLGGTARQLPVSG